MTITQIAQQVLEEHSAVQIRLPPGIKQIKCAPKEYDWKPLFCGSRRGWTVLDATTANAIMTVYRGIQSDDLRSKFDTIPLVQLIGFCWRMVA